MQFKHWSALGPSQPWSPHSGWHGPEERETGSVWEKLSTLQAPLPGCPEHTLPGPMDTWTVHLSYSISCIYYILNFFLSVLWSCMALGACLSCSSSFPELIPPSHPLAEYWCRSSFERGTCSSGSSRDTRSCPCWRREGGQRSCFYHSDSCTTNLWREC